MKRYRSFRIYIWKDIKEEEMFKEIVKKNKERINDYFTVLVFNKYKDMYEIVDKIEENMDWKVDRNKEEEYNGRTLLCRQQLYEDDNSEIWGYSKAQGFIYLCDECGVTFNTISHEVGHAVIGYMGAYFKNKIKFRKYEDKNVDNKKDILYEELFCYITGSLNNQIVIKF